MSHRLRDPNPRGKATTSFLKGVRRATTSPAIHGSLTQQTVSSYKLSWDNLKTFLEKKFPKDKYPSLEFKERKVRRRMKTSLVYCIDIGHRTDQ